MKRFITGLAAATMTVAASLALPSAAQSGEIVIGQLGDRTGATASIGVIIGAGINDYVKLFNKKGGVGGHTIRMIEVDTQYKVPPAVEAYQRFKSENAVLVGLWGTPITQALTADLAKDKIPGTSPGFGTAASADGNKYPYLFPMAPSYWSQSGAAIQYVGQQLGSLKGKKIAFLFYDNPAGRESLPVLRRLSKLEGFKLGEFPVPPPGVDMSNQVRDISRRFRADFVISHLFGRAPAVQLKELSRSGYPLKKVLSYVWGGSESDVLAAGGFAANVGFTGLQFAGVGDNYPIRQEIRDMYKADGKTPPKEMDSTVFYNRGLLVAAVHLQAVSNAVKAKGGSANITGVDVRNGFQSIKNFSLGGLVPPLNISQSDHEGGGWVRAFQVTKDGFVPATDWFRGYRDIVLDMVKTANK